MKRRRFIGLILLFSLTTAMAGCGEETRGETAAQEVELLEPVGMTGSGRLRGSATCMTRISIPLRWFPMWRNTVLTRT